MKRVLMACTLFGLLVPLVVAQGADVSLNIKSYGIIENSERLQSSKLSSWSAYIMMSNEDKDRLHGGLLEPPDIFRSDFWFGKHVSTIHKSYPDKKIIVYRNVRAVKAYRTQNWARQGENRIVEYEPAVQNDWILRDTSGEYVSITAYENLLLADIGDAGWQQFVADWIKFYIDKYDYDGVFLDCGLSAKTNEAFFSVSAEPLNPRTGAVFTDKEIVEYYNQMHKKIRETIGEDKLIVCNGIWYGKRFFERKDGYLKILNQNVIDGFQSEGIFGGNGRFLSEEDWKRSVDFVVWIQDNWLSKGKIFVPNVDFYFTDGEYRWPKGLTLEEWTTFVFASTLLGIKAETSERNYFSVFGVWFQPFVQKLDSLDLGKPINTCYLFDTGIYARDFQKGKVLVNPTLINHTINLDQKFRTLDNETVTTITLNSHRGLILLKEEA